MNLFYTLLLTIIISLSFMQETLAEGLSAMLAVQDTDTTATNSEANSLRPIGFLQQQFTYHSDANDPTAFSIHRARVGIAGEITNRISVNILTGAVEPPDNKPHLVNAFVDLDLDPLLSIRTGQFLVPFGLEGPEVIIFNPAIERTVAIRRLNTVNMFRDIGIQASGSTAWFHYAIALMNGAGANNAAQISPKEIFGRVGIVPTERLEVGLSGHLGRHEVGPGSHYRRYRVGTDFTYQLNPLLIRGELMTREEDRPGNSSLSQLGGYLLGAYHVTDNWQGLLRFEFHDPDTGVDGNRLTSWTAGVNYYITGQTRMSVNYEFRNDRIDTDTGDLFTMQLQIAL